MRHANDSKLHFGDSVSGCYTQLTFADRRILHGVVDQKVSIIDIARRLGRHRSTMYREIRRNTFPHNQLPEYTGYFGTIVDELRREGGDVWGKLLRSPNLRAEVISHWRLGGRPKRSSDA